ncbi:MAG: hypothetical protein WC693_06160 [Patescibacteria group bacterium]|jgi:hypothetical protein
MQTNLSKSIIFCILLTAVFFISAPVFAQTQSQSAPIQEPVLQIPIPNLTFSNAVSSGGFASLPWLAQYIAAMYRYGIGIASFCAIIMIMAGGVRWLTAGGNPGNVTTAKNMITGATLGLILTLGSYLVLSTVNPNLVSFGDLQIQLVGRQTFENTDTAEESYQTSGGAETGDTSGFGLVNIKGENMMSRVNGQAKAGIVSIFQKAAQNIAGKGCTIASASGARPATVQLQLTKNYCKWSEQYKTYVNCKPAVGIWGSTNTDGTPKSTTCKYQDPYTPLKPCDINGYEHQNAIDAFAVETSTGRSTSGGLRCYGATGCMNERCQKELIKEMNADGACVLLGKDKNPAAAAFEPWHFQPGSSASCFTNAIQIFDSIAK